MAKMINGSEGDAVGMRRRPNVTWEDRVLEYLRESGG